VQSVSSIVKQQGKAAGSAFSKKEGIPFFKPFVQPKLTINQPSDIYEQEADAVADKAMQMTNTEPVQTKFFKPVVSLISRKCAHCEAEGHKMQRKEKNNEETGAGTELENYISTLDQGGSPLSNEVRNFYEPRLGCDFSNVKLHTNTIAAKSAQSINALAYTTGNNIVFNNGQYSPTTESGKRLLGHELTHVIQQSAMKPASSLASGLQTKQDNTPFLKSNTSGDPPVIQRVAFHESPSLEDIEIREEENNVMRKMGVPDVQRMERVNSSDPSRITGGNVHPWSGQPPVGDNMNVGTDGGSTVSAWVAYGGAVADRYWCHGYTLGTFNESLYSVYSGPPMGRAVRDEYHAVSPASVQAEDIAVWLPNFDHSCVFQNVVRSGSSLDYSLTMMSTKNGRSPLQNLSLDGVNAIYGTPTNQPSFFRHN